MVNGFTFAGERSIDFNLYVEHYPVQKGPTRKRTTISIPGRNGDLHYDEDAFENYQQPYECGFYGTRHTPEMAHAIKKWLLFSGTYQRLEDVHDPGYFRLASFAGPFDIENQLNRIGKCVITFDCKPQSFLTLGEFPVLYDSPGRIFNDYMTSLPLITVYGTGDGTVAVGDSIVQIIGQKDVIVLDCEMQNAYHEVDGVKDNRNSYISAAKFPCLHPGSNVIGWTGGVERLEIIPRWWTL